nr:ricin B lectin domain-containing protein [Tanacetum cinerariifolium]
MRIDYCHDQENDSEPLPSPKCCHGDWVDQGMEECCRPPSVSENNQNTAEEECMDPMLVRVYAKEKIDFSLSILDGMVILAPVNPSDPLQQWVKDDKFGKHIKDEEGCSSFALINKATGQAIKHSIGVTYPVQLTDYNPDKVDKSVLWTLGKNLGDGYRAIRAVDNIHLNLDAYEGIPKLGGVHDGTHIVLWDWFGNDKHRWTIIAY